MAARLSTRTVQIAHNVLVRAIRQAEECEGAMREAIEFHIEGLRLAGEPVPPATSHVAIVTVAA